MPVPNLSLLSPILHPLCFRSSKNRLAAESTSWRVRSWYKCPLSSVSGPLSSVYSHLVSTYSWNHKIKFFFCFLKIRKARNTKCHMFIGLISADIVADTENCQVHFVAMKKIKITLTTVFPPLLLTCRNHKYTKALYGHWPDTLTHKTETVAGSWQNIWKLYIIN